MLCILVSENLLMLLFKKNLGLNPVVCGRRAHMLRVPANDSFTWVDSSKQTRSSESNYNCFFFIGLNEHWEQIIITININYYYHSSTYSTNTMQTI